MIFPAARRRWNRQWRVDLDFTIEHTEHGKVREHAGHRIGLSLDGYRSANDGGIGAVPTPPKPVREQHNPVATELFVFRDEDASERGFDTDQREKIR